MDDACVMHLTPVRKQLCCTTLLCSFLWRFGQASIATSDGDTSCDSRGTHKTSFSCRRPDECAALAQAQERQRALCAQQDSSRSTSPRGANSQSTPDICNAPTLL